MTRTVLHTEIEAEEKDLIEQVDLLRLQASKKLEQNRRSELGQFLSPSPVARLMASMLQRGKDEVYILDAGAGVGSLFAAAVAELCKRSNPPRLISVTAYELDGTLASYIPQTLELCRIECKRAGIRFEGTLHETDFIERAVTILSSQLFAVDSPPKFNCAIVNPPYRKIHSRSEHRILLRRIGIETSNLYTAFLAAIAQLLEPEGELIAITPRSFCNGPYFKSFRNHFLQSMSLRRLHVFESRVGAFSDDEVLQENVILHAVKSGQKPKTVTVSHSNGPRDDMVSLREVSYSQVVSPNDPQSFIHLVTDDLGERIARRMAMLRSSLPELGLQVSTGRVVDFRATEFLRPQPIAGTVALIYPTHFTSGYVAWPKADTKKPNALLDTEDTKELLVPNENYVLTKRFSAKEEKKRIVAAVYQAKAVPGSKVGFENHLNYFHRNGRGLDLALAKGLSAFLNSTLVDAYFRQFNGHTQVNATDLRSLKYPTHYQLQALGAAIEGEFPRQEDLDRLVEKELFGQ